MKTYITQQIGSAFDGPDIEAESFEDAQSKCPAGYTVLGERVLEIDTPDIGRDQTAKHRVTDQTLISELSDESLIRVIAKRMDYEAVHWVPDYDALLVRHNGVEFHFKPHIDPSDRDRVMLAMPNVAVSYEVDEDGMNCTLVKALDYRGSVETYTRAASTLGRAFIEAAVASGSRP